MKKINILLLSIIFVGCVTSNSVAELESGVMNLHEAELKVEGMTCISCAMGVEYQLKQVDGVVDCNIDYATGKGTVKYDADKVDAATIVKASDVFPTIVVSDVAI